MLLCLSVVLPQASYRVISHVHVMYIHCLVCAGSSILGLISPVEMI